MQLFIQVDNIAQAEAVIDFLAGFEGKPDDRESDRATNRPTKGQASDEDSWGDESVPDANDPWSDEPIPEKPGGSQRGSERRSGGTGPWAEVPSNGDRWSDTKNGKRHYEFGLDDAPDCHCGHAAVKFSGKGAKGLWSKWQCALSSTKSYKDKCDFEEWASRK